MTGNRTEWSAGLFHVAGADPRELEPCRIVIVAIVRNEAWRLPFWLAYHRWIGAEHFMVVNNRSDDETAAFCTSQPDVTLFDAPGPYQRVGWKREIVNRAPPVRWNLILDADELFVSLPWVEGGLKRMIEWLDSEQAEAAAAIMVDCYPETLPLSPAQASPVPWRRAPYFDPGPYLKWDAARGRAHHRFGGVRERLLWPRWRYVRRIKHLFPRRLGRHFFGDGPPFVRKMPLLRNVATLSFDSIHGSTGVRVAREMFAILHYKLDVDLDEKVASALAERQYADHSRDYEAYASLTKAKSMRVKNARSRTFTSVGDLEAAGLVISSAGFDRYLGSKGPRSVGRDEAEEQIWLFGEQERHERAWRHRWAPFDEP